MGGTEGIGLIIYSGSRDELQAKLRARDDKITDLEFRIALLESTLRHVGVLVRSVKFKDAIEAAENALALKP